MSEPPSAGISPASSSTAHSAAEPALRVRADDLGAADAEADAAEQNFIAASPDFRSFIRPVSLAYGIAILGTALVVFVRIVLLEPLLGDEASLILFLIPAAAAAWYGGLKPGLLATAIGAIAGSYLLRPGAFEVASFADQLRLSTFVAVGVLVSWLCEAVHFAHRGVAARECRLEQEAIERRDLKMRLERNEERLRLALDTARLGSWRLDLTSGTLDCSAECKANFGLPPQSALSYEQLTTELIHPEDRAAMRDKVDLALVNRTDYDAEYRALWPDGSTHWIIARGRASYGADGKPEHMAGVTFDITARKLAEENARRSEQRLKLITDGVPFLISYIDSDQRYRFNNKAYDTWFHYSAEDIRGKPVREVVGDAAYEKIRGHIEAALAGILTNYEAEVPFKSGGTRWIHSAYTPDIDDEGRVRGIFTSVADITREKHAEIAVRDSEQRYREASEKFAALNSQLEQRVAERTALSEQRAAQLRALTLQLSHAESQERRRIAQMLHDDVQQLLLSGKFRLDALKKTTPAADIAPVVEMLDAGIKASRSLACELSPPVLYQLNLEASLRWLAEREQEQHGLHVEVRASGAAIALGDAVKVLLYQAVRELLLNIVKHAGTPAARITLHGRANDVMVRVEDKGAGFDSSLYDGPANGSGFGLFSIRERLEALGGKMIVSARPGLGTRVSLIVPVTAAGQGALGVGEKTVPPLSLLRALAPESAGSGAIRVLIADDHRLVREGLRDVIQAENDMQVVGEAQNGEQAIELAAKLRPDVILMDINMPITDGVKATRRIKADPEHSNIVVIAVSMHNDEAIMQSMRNAGAAAYVPKDMVPTMLCETIRAHRVKQTPDADTALSA